jgi:hypothetical protein
MEFCPVCMLRGALPGAAESGASFDCEDTVKPTSGQPAQRFDHYALVTGKDGKPVELGRGAMGVTYKAFDVDLRCPVTLRNYRATGAVLDLPYFLTLKAEALYLADRTSEALEALSENEALAERFEQSFWCAELHRLRGVFLAIMGAEETQIEASFWEAIRIAKQQKSISLEKRAEATYAEFRRQKTSGERGFRLPLW